MKVLANAQGFIAIPFVVNIGSSAPPSVRLIPCRPYSGAPIGTGYEVQLFTGKDNCFILDFSNATSSNSNKK